MEILRASARWLPSNGDTYFVIVAQRTIKRVRWHDTDADYEAWNFGNCFKDRRTAKRARATMKKMLALRYVFEHNETKQSDVYVAKAPFWENSQ